MASNLTATARDSRQYFRLPRDPLRIALFGLIVLTISRVHQAFPAFGRLHPGMILTGLAVGAAAVNPRLLAKGWTRRWPTKVVAGIACLTLASIAFGISQGGAWWFFSTYFSRVLFVAFLVMASTRDARDVWFFSWAYVVACAILVWMALFEFGLSAGPNGNLRLSNLYTWDANGLGLVLLVGLPLSILLIRTSSARGRVFATVVLIGIGAAIARSGSRGAFLGLGCVLLAYLFSLQGRSLVRGFGVIFALVGALAVAAPHGYWRQMHTLTSIQTDYNWDTTQGRKQLAIDGLNFMLTHPVFGIGVGNFGRAEATISAAAKRHRPGAPGLRWSVGHNSYVEIGAELGIPGLVLFVGLVFGCIVGSWRLRRRIPRRWEHGTAERQFLYHAVLYLPLAGVGFAVPAIFLSFEYHDPIYILAAMSGALLSSVQAKLKEDARQRRLSRNLGSRLQLTHSQSRPHVSRIHGGIGGKSTTGWPR